MHRVSFQIQANNEIFKVCKLMYRFVERCRLSKNSLVAALMQSFSYFPSKYYAHYRDFLFLDNILESVVFFKDNLPQ